MLANHHDEKVIGNRDFIKDLYANYNITTVKAKRLINSDASKRGAIEEVLIRNYGTE